MGEPDGVLVFDPSAVPKKGTGSVGVQRQWCGRLGKLENCQVGIYLAYVSRREHALVDVRLYLPEEWAGSRKRMTAAGVPRGVDRWAAARPAGAWRTVEVRDAAKGPLVVQVARGLVQALAERRPSDVAEVAVAVRE